MESHSQTERRAIRWVLNNDTQRSSNLWLAHTDLSRLEQGHKRKNNPAGYNWGNHDAVWKFAILYEHRHSGEHILSPHFDSSPDFDISANITSAQQATSKCIERTHTYTHTHTHADSLLSIWGSRAENACLHNRFLRMYALRIAELQNHWALSFATEIQPKENGKPLVWGVSFLSSLISLFIVSSVAWLRWAELSEPRYSFSSSSSSFFFFKNGRVWKWVLLKKAVSLFSLCLSRLVFARDKLCKECLCLHVDTEYTPRWPCHSSLFIAAAWVCMCVRACVFVSLTCDKFPGEKLETLKHTPPHTWLAVRLLLALWTDIPRPSALSCSLGIEPCVLQC